MSRNQRIAKILHIAGKLLIAAPLEEALDALAVWNLTKNEPHEAWLWDRNGTGEFVKGGSQHFALAMKIAKKHKLSKSYEGLESKAEEMLDGEAVRGYYFPKSNKVAIYPILSGMRYIDAKDDSIFRHVVQKLGAKPSTTGIAIQDEYYIPAN